MAKKGMDSAIKSRMLGNGKRGDEDCVAPLWSRPFRSGLARGLADDRLGYR